MTDIVASTIHGQLGKETTAGTTVSADKQMLSFGFSRWSPKGEGTILTPQGYKVPTTLVPVGRTWVEGTYDGAMDFNEFEYPLNSVVNSTSPTTEAINAKHWVHTVNAAAVETRNTFTLEQGNNQHAQKAGFMFFNSLKLEMSELTQKMSGAYMAQAFTDDITLTASPTILTPQVIPPQSFDVRIASTRAALIGTQQVETATAAGTTSGAGNITVTITSAAAAALVSGKAIVVALASGDTPTVWAGKVRTALAADIDVSGALNVSGSTTAIILTARAAAANDTTLNIAIADTGSIGVTPVVTSTNTTPGVAAASVYARPFGVMFDLPNVVDVITRMNSSDTSYIAALDIPIAPIVTFTTDADDAGMGYLANWLAGSQTFISVTATGGAITGSNATYAFRFMAACRIKRGYNPTEVKGNARAEWPMDLIYDPTSSMLFQIDNWNTLAAL
jgi:hypothetical protein